MAVTSGFDGFPKATLKFLRDLGKNNEREWFHAQKKHYESVYKAPAKAFCLDMEEALEKLTGTPHASKVFRINRDLRFSKDKTPYNTHLHISFIAESKKKHAVQPIWMFGLDPKTLSVGLGVFDFGKAIGAYRDGVAGPEGAALAKKLSAMAKKGIRINGEPELKRVPKGYDPDHKRSELLRRKSLSVWSDFDKPRDAEDPKLVGACIKRFKQLAPVSDWLASLT